MPCGPGMLGVGCMPSERFVTVIGVHGMQGVRCMARVHGIPGVRCMAGVRCLSDVLWMPVADRHCMPGVRCVPVVRCMTGLRCLSDMRWVPSVHTSDRCLLHAKRASLYASDRCALHDSDRATSRGQSQV